MKNKVNHSMLAVMGLMTLKAQAVGLGELVVHSKLGEPLTAEIKVIQSNGEFVAADDLVVNIATENEHAKRSLDGYFARQSLQLKLAETLNDDVSLKLSSNQPINEPFLNFLVELKWNAGRIIKEFTILLDPPGFQAQQTVTEAAPVTTAAVITESSKTTQQTYRFQPSVKPVADTPFANGQYGPVQKGETLSEIAMRVRPAGYGIPLVKMIDAIYLNNQDAFINGDKNLLQRGVVLNIPEVNEVLAISNTPAQSTAPAVAKPQAQPITNIEQAAIHFGTTTPSIDLNTSYTFSGLKLSTELDQSFLEAAKTTTTEPSIEAVAELDETPVVAETEIETPETELVDASETEQVIIEEPAADEPVAYVPDDSTALVNETDNEVVEDNDAITSETVIGESSSIADDFESTVSAIDAASNEQVVAETESTSSSNPIYLAISIIGAVLFLSMSALLFYFRRNREQDFHPNINLNIDKAHTIPSRVFVNEETNNTQIDAEPVKDIEEAITETVAESAINEADDLMDMEQTISEKTNHIATVVMSPEEFAEVGIDVNNKEEGFYLDKEHDDATSQDDQTLINDFLDTVELPDDLDDEPVIEEHSDFSIVEKALDSDNEDSTEDETFIDISVPLNHQDNEVNTIINEILEGELDEEAPENDSLIIDKQEDEFIDVPESSNSADDLELKTITQDANEMRLDSDLIDLDADTETVNGLEPLEFDNPEIDEPEVFDAPNIEDLVVNFQTSHPEKEFEKQVSVFMAYGDYVGAEEVIEKALNNEPKNNTYRLAQLSLFKATGKFGAALVLSQELSLIKHELSEIEQKKLELLSDDLNQDDNDSINVAS